MTDLDGIIAIIKEVVELVIAMLNGLRFEWNDISFTFWAFLLVSLVFSVIAFALFRSRGGDDD